jgi:hypothetical protein
VKLTAPAVSPVIKPELSMVATAGLLLIQVPPVPGLAVIVDPIHNVGEGMDKVGSA